jgi:Arc/MetJ family transcription regulator
MLKRVEIVIDDDLVQEATRRYHQADAREAVHLALRVLLSKDGAAAEQQEDEYDKFSDLSAWQRRPNSGTG